MSGLFDQQKSGGIETSILNSSGKAVSTHGCARIYPLPCMGTGHMYKAGITVCAIHVLCINCSNYKRLHESADEMAVSYELMTLILLVVPAIDQVNGRNGRSGRNGWTHSFLRKEYLHCTVEKFIFTGRYDMFANF